MSASPSVRPSVCQVIKIDKLCVCLIGTATTKCQHVQNVDNLITYLLNQLFIRILLNINLSKASLKIRKSGYILSVRARQQRVSHLHAWMTPCRALVSTLSWFLTTIYVNLVFGLFLAKVVWVSLSSPPPSIYQLPKFIFTN